jgi:hypothetical protein
LVANGSRVPARFLSTKSITMRGMNSNAVSPVPAVSCARLNSPSADLKVRHGDDGGRLLHRARKQLEHRRRDDAERAFRADEKVSQVVAGVVLLQGPEAVPDAPSASTTSRPSTSWRVLP